MKHYKVINPFRLKDHDGMPKGYAEIGNIAHGLSDAEIERLLKANCIEEVETMTKTAPEDRRRKRGLNSGK